MFFGCFFLNKRGKNVKIFDNGIETWSIKIIPSLFQVSSFGLLSNSDNSFLAFFFSPFGMKRSSRFSSKILLISNTLITYSLKLRNINKHIYGLNLYC